MWNKYKKFVTNNPDLCFALDILIITGGCYLLKVNCFITILLIALYVFFIFKNFSYLFFKRKVDKEEIN